MRRRWKILLFGLCGVIAVVAVCFFCLREQEPSYNGRTLSEWLGTLVPIDDEQESTEITAVRKIGTNAIPSLLNWGGAKDSQIHNWIAVGVTNLPVQLRRKWFRPIVYNTSAERKHFLAIRGFRILGTNALPALPELERRFQSTNGSYEAGMAVQLMQYLGKDAFDFFLNAAQQSPDEFHTRLGIHGIGTMASEMKTNAMAAVPVLLQIMQNRKDEARVRAITALGQLKLQPELVVPAMTNQIDVPMGRYFVIWTIGEFGPDARSAIPLLTNALHDRDPSIKSGARYALMKIAPEVLTNKSTSN